MPTTTSPLRSFARCVLALMLAAVLALIPVLAACSDEEQKMTHVTVSVWDGSVISSGFADYVDALNPSCDIEWLVGSDSLSLYEYQAENGSLPDVILTRDFDQVVASELTESLYTLDGTDLVDSYNADYLSSYPGNEEGVKYVPGDAGFEGILVNEYLFDLYDIAIPTDRDSFVEACNAFDEVGLRGFVAGLGDSETCYEVFQGFADSSLVTETEDVLGQLSALASGSQGLTLDDASFDEVLAFANRLIAQKVIRAEDTTMSPDAAKTVFLQGAAAMLFIGTGQASTFGDQYNMTVSAIPFFGSSDSWALAEPSFVGMVSNVQVEGVKTTASDETVHAAAVEVLTSIMSIDAQNEYLRLTGVDKLVSTSGEDAFELPSALQSLQPCLDEGRVRLYVPSRTLAQAMGSTLQSIIAGKQGSSEALDAVRESLEETTQESKVVAATFTEGVSNLFDSTSGNAAAIEIAQVACAQLGCDFFITSSYAARCPLYAGDKTSEELTLPVARTTVMRASLTGSQINDLLSRAVSRASRVGELPVTAGLHIEVARTTEGYQLTFAGRIEGSSTDAQIEELDPDRTYTVAMAGYSWEPVYALSGEYGFQDQEVFLQSVWLSAYEDGTVSGLPARQSYFSFSTY